MKLKSPARLLPTDSSLLLFVFLPVILSDISLVLCLRTGETEGQRDLFFVLIDEEEEEGRRRRC